jgi:hypothetical protein
MSPGTPVKAQPQLGLRKTGTAREFRRTCDAVEAAFDDSVLPLVFA